MFTGIIEELGTLKTILRRSHSLRLVIGARKVLKKTALGDSIAVNGVCLTVTDLTTDTFAADIMTTTFQRTNLYLLSPGSQVNLERALQLNTRLGGHLVTGHVDEVGTLVQRGQEQNSLRLTFRCSPDLTRFLVARGSIAIDGISLTVAAVQENQFEVGIIPHTLAHTTLNQAGPGTKVNLESDILARYVEKLMTSKSSSGLTMEQLLSQGF
jgi:riboflavin synthase